VRALKLPRPICKITFNPDTSYYGLIFHYDGQGAHHAIDTSKTPELILGISHRTETKPAAGVEIEEASALRKW
jgi:hypothetical protein